MPSTSHGLPYPAGSSPTNVPGDMGALAAAIDTMLASSLDAWTSYTPTWTGATTNPVMNNGTIVGAYRQVGKTVNFRIVITMGTTTTYGSGAYSVSLPVTAVDARVTHNGTIRQAATTPIFGEQATTTTLQLRIITTGTGATFTNMVQGTPVTLASTNVIALSGTYEAA